MKNVKFAWLFVLGFIITMASCDQQEVDPLADDESAILDLMFLATTEDSTNTFRNHKGKCDLTEVAADELPAAITDYITANYDGASIERAGTSTEKGIYAVAIKKADGTFSGVIFDLEGNFLKEKTRGPKGTPVAAEDLPSAITDHIAANYDGATVAKAFTHQDGRFGVLLILADDTFQGVGFDADGNFVGEFSLKNKRGKKFGPGKRGPFAG
ncbi:MAG: hypothetical protein ACI9IP_003427 [Arcticibacterium sp.]|jgi:hypothetical protein